MKLYVNGEEKREETGSIVKTHSFVSDSIFIGRDRSGNYFHGSLDRFQLYSGALSDTTIKGLPNDHGWPGYQGAIDHRSEVTVDIVGNGHIDFGVDFNDGYRYTNSITKDTVLSFPEVSTVDFTFMPDGIGVIDSVLIDGRNQGSIPSYSYPIRDTEDGTINVFFSP